MTQLVTALGVAETTTSGGTGTKTLAGPLSKDGVEYRGAAGGAIASGARTTAYITSGAQHEWLIVEYLEQEGVRTITPDQVLASTNGGAAVNWTEGQVKTVVLGLPLLALQASKEGNKVVLPGADGTWREYALPNAAGTLVDLASAQSLSNKALASPTVSGTVGGAAAWAGVQTYSAGIATDTINEKTADAGVTVDGVTIKDGMLILTSSEGVRRHVDTSFLYVSGGSVYNQSAHILLRGSSHSTAPSQGDLRANNTVALRWDENYVASPQAYAATTSNAANVYINSNGIFRSTSSEKYKDQIEPVDPAYSVKIVYEAEPIWYRSLCGADRPDWSWWGLSAEREAARDPRLVSWATEEYVEEDVEELEPVTEPVLVSRVEVVDGRAVLREAEERRPVVDVLPVVDEAGAPVMVPGADGEPVALTIEQPRLAPVTRPRTVLRQLPAAEPNGVHYTAYVPHLIVVAQQQRARIDALEQQLAALAQRLDAAGL